MTLNKSHSEWATTVTLINILLYTDHADKASVQFIKGQPNNKEYWLVLRRTG